MNNNLKRPVTVPTDIGIVEKTKEIIELWGADAVRDCDGTKMPDEFEDYPIKIYSNYYTTRKDNEWAEANPDEIQQVYLMTEFHIAMDETLNIPIMKDFYKEQLKPNTLNDIKRWWEVIDRTTGEVVSVDKWEYNKKLQEVQIPKPKKHHSYTVSFLAFIIWDPVHMYNYITNDWKEVEHQLTYDVRQPKTKKYALKKFKKWIKENPATDVVRFTTFFHQFTLIFNKKGKEKFVDWFGYSASVSPYILKKFEKEVGYSFRPEHIIDQGYHNNTFRVPSREFKDFQTFQQREVAKLAKKFVDICHKNDKEAMMFFGDHWIGAEPYGEYFKDIGLDSVVGSVGNGTTLRLISDIPGLKYTEGRFLPYFFPDVFNENKNPIKNAKENWVTARRAILRSPVDRIGYGGYLKLALKFPDFIEYIEEVTSEFKTISENINNKKPYSHLKIGVLNSWGKLRSWGTHMVAHAIDYKQTYSYNGILESLSGMPFDVGFISFDDVIEDSSVLTDYDVIINMGDAYTAQSGGKYWLNPVLTTAVREFVADGGGFIGVGEPTAFQNQGRYFALADILGVDKEISFSLSTNKYNWTEKDHFITKNIDFTIDFGEVKKNIYAHKNTKVLKTFEKDLQLAVNEFGNGKSVYISGLPYSLENSRILYRAIFWSAGKTSEIKRWYSDNYNIEVNYYPKSSKYCVVNNTYEPQKTVVYDGEGISHKLSLKENEILWFKE